MRRRCSRVIARPFSGAPGQLDRGPSGGRTSACRRRGRRCSTAWPTATCRGWAWARWTTSSPGGASRSVHPANNAEAYGAIASALAGMRAGFLFANVIEFDQTWGHRNDVPGFHRGLLQLDAALPGLLAPVRDEDLIILPPTTGTIRRRPPPIIRGSWCRCWPWGPAVRPARWASRQSFADVGQTRGGVPRRGAARRRPVIPA